MREKEKKRDILRHRVDPEAQPSTAFNYMYMHIYIYVCIFNICLFYAIISRYWIYQDSKIFSQHIQQIVTWPDTQTTQCMHNRCRRFMLKQHQDNLSHGDKSSIQNPHTYTHTHSHLSLSLYIYIIHIFSMGQSK